MLPFRVDHHFRGLIWGAISLLLIPCVTTLAASERNTSLVKRAFRDATREASRSTVHVMVDGRRVALGAIVSAEGHVLTKASELDEPLRCQLFEGEIVDATLIGVDEQWDVALLQLDVDRTLSTVKWRQGEPPPVGSWLATPGLQSVPISIGVVSVAEREIERRRPALGVVLEDSSQGPRIHRVLDNSAAAGAGLRTDDVVTHLDGQAMSDRDELIETIRERRPGDRVRLDVLRGDETLEVEVVLGEWAQMVHGDRANFQANLGGRLSDRRSGFPVALQHDTVLRPNQCGGPLVGLDGYAVGLNIARASRIGSYAIPASAIPGILEGLLAAAEGANGAEEVVLTNGA